MRVARFQIDVTMIEDDWERYLGAVLYEKTEGPKITLGERTGKEGEPFTDALVSVIYELHTGDIAPIEG